ncbi:hypothetical protein AGMMS49546_39420 [Spirochaetia bacterium]|nr:hypothetical protein AGMMS49546_39420 [Spirochaetia bacterium]
MNNPQETRTVQGIVNSVHLFLHTDIGNRKVCILVEGPHDVKTYSNFFKEVKSKVMIRKGKGKSRVKEALKILSKDKKYAKHAIGICDADFDHLDNKKNDIESLFVTDYHDIEMTFLHFSDVLRSALTKLAIPGDAETLRETAMQTAIYLSYIRWYNNTNQCNLYFRGLDFNRIAVKNNKIQIDIEKIINILNSRSKNKIKAISKNDIDSFIVENKTDDYFNLCNGHDVTTLFTLAIGKDHESFFDALRTSFQLSYFMQTMLYKSILAWQTKHGFDILQAAE